MAANSESSSNKASNQAASRPSKANSVARASTARSSDCLEHSDNGFGSHFYLLRFGLSSGGLTFIAPGTTDAALILPWVTSRRKKPGDPLNLQIRSLSEHEKNCGQ